MRNKLRNLRRKIKSKKLNNNNQKAVIKKNKRMVMLTLTMKVVINKWVPMDNL